jgi:uncharacterized GH25 family protein
MTKDVKPSDEILKLVNHEAWIEVENRGYLMWGHHPKTDGKLDPCKIKRAFATYNGCFLPVVIGRDKSASERNALFIEFEKADAIAVEYDSGIYTLTEDGKWLFGKVNDPKYRVVETRWFLGFASVHLSNPKPLGLEFEIVPRDVDIEEGKVLSVDVLYRGKPVPCVLKVSNSNGTSQIETDGKAEIEVSSGVNVLTARYIDDLVLGVDKRHLVTTLTIQVE